jgi:hypothetical protein
MKNKVVQDIVPPGGRSIRRIPVERVERRETIVHMERKEEVFKMPPPPKHTVPQNKPKRRGGRGWAVFFVAIISLTVIGLALSMVFAKGTLTVVPKIESKTLTDASGTYIAKRDPVKDELEYSFVIISGSATSTVTATDGPLVETKAKGTVLIYNAYSSTPQKIVATTRLANTDGLIYRTDATITIPAMQTVSGKKVPGSVAVNVTADKAGQEYNLNADDLKGDFKIVAYQDTPKEDLFYGRIQKPIVGGFSGKKKIVEESVLAKAKTDAERDLKERLEQEINKTLPENVFIPKSTYKISYRHDEPIDNGKGGADIKSTASLWAITFPIKDLVRKLAPDEAKMFGDLSYETEGLDSSIFTILNSKDIDPQKDSSLSFKVDGEISLVGSFSKEKLASDIAGLSLEESKEVIADYGTISSATATLTPKWPKRFPKDPGRITIELSR